MTTEAVTKASKREAPDNTALFEAADEFFAAIKRDAPEEEIRAIMMKVPISPKRALVMKRVYGKEFLLEEFNLSEANAAFGEGWLDE